MKKRPRAPLRIQARAMATARWDLPVPVPPISTTLRCCSRKSPPARSPHQCLVDGRVLEVELVDLLGEREFGRLVSWYLIERACFSLISAIQQIPDGSSGARADASPPW